MNLYKLIVYLDGKYQKDYYVIAKDEYIARRFLMKKYEEWDLSNFFYVGIIELIAVEGQYGKPIPLLICK